MRITARTLFLACAVFLHLIELISSSRTLEELFPGCKGVLPPIKEVEVTQRIYNLPNFRTLSNRHMDFEMLIFLKRGEFIFGYKSVYTRHSESIKPLSELFGLENVFVVYDLENKQWEGLSEEALEDLGVTRNYALVNGREQLVPKPEKTYRKRQTIPNAHQSLRATKASKKSTEEASNRYH